MKKILFGLLLITAVAHGQRAAINNDTLAYAGKSYASGDTVNIFYGSGVNKKFAFIQKGGGVMGLEPLEARYSKMQVVVDKVYKSLGKYYLRGKLIGENIPGYKIFVDVEGAVDNKELAP